MYALILNEMNSEINLKDSELPTKKIIKCLLRVCHRLKYNAPILSLVCPRVGGGGVSGNPGE